MVWPEKKKKHNIHWEGLNFHPDVLKWSQPHARHILYCTGTYIYMLSMLNGSMTSHPHSLLRGWPCVTRERVPLDQGANLCEDFGPAQRHLPCWSQVDMLLSRDCRDGILQEPLCCGTGPSSLTGYKIPPFKKGAGKGLYHSIQNRLRLPICG